MLFDQTIIALDYISWLNANIRGIQCYGVVVKPLYYDYFPVLFHAVVKNTPPFVIYVFFGQKREFFKRGA